MSERLGIDIGGSGIKGAIVDLDGGELVGERLRVETPEPATPQAVAETLAGLIAEFDYEGQIGVGFPAVLVDGVARTANNIDKGWIGTNALELFTEITGRHIHVINDADAAALCELAYGAAADIPGLVVVLTFGSGIGSGLLADGHLIPNSELGVIELEAHSPAESYFAAKARKRDDLSWEEWGERTNRYLAHVNKIFSPTRIVVSGGVSKKWEKWSHVIDPELPVVRAEWANNAGIVGAATLVA